MSPASNYKLSDRYVQEQGTVFLTGIQAMARLPLEQIRADRAVGRTTAALCAGYPGSPLGGLDAAFAQAARFMPDADIVLRPSVNEEYAATSVMGSQLAAARPDARYDGVMGFWYGKAPGVDRASDAIRHGVFAGADPNGGVVLLAGDDPNAKSSTIPSSSAGLLADLHIPVLYPGDPADVLHLGRHAVAMSRATGLWVSLKIVANVADGSSTVALDTEPFVPNLPLVDGHPYQHLPNHRLLTPYSLDIEREIVKVRLPLALEYAALNRLNRATVNPSDAWIGIIASGITHWEVREALGVLGLDSDEDIADAGIRILRMGMPIPFNASLIRDFSQGLSEVMVIEEKSPSIELRIKDALYNAAHRPVVVGQHDEHDQPLIKSHGALNVDDLLAPLQRRLQGRLGDRLRTPPPHRERIPLSVSRTPFFCSGCPHNRSTVVEPGTAVGAGIGCHTMVLLGEEPRYGDITGLTCMGSEGLQWVGMSPFVDTPHLVQNIGDGTFFHSGQHAITAAVAAGVNITYKLLWNGVVAMTGGQDPAGGIPLDRVCQVLLAQGVAKVVITSDDPARTRSLDLPAEVDVADRRELMDVQRELAAIDGVTVLIHDQRCAAELRSRRRRGQAEQPRTRVAINHRVCEGCGDCATVSNCLSVQPIDTVFGRKTTIDQDSCNLDLSCLEGDCPAFVTVTQPRRPRRSRRRRQRAAAAGPMSIVSPPEGLPDPPPSAPEGNVHITGVGGTGVVTTAHIVATAAMLDGSEVHGLDQIGLSQKAGPVVSDLRITRRERDGSNRVGAQQADLLLVLDLLVAASRKEADVSDPARTAVVGSLDVTPPGTTTAHPEIPVPPTSELLARVDAVTRPEARHWAEASHITETLTGTAAGTNILVVGMAVQAGLLPVSAEAIENAIELNGVAVQANVAAFRWGRWQVADPARVDEAMAERSPTVRQPPAPPDRVVSRIVEVADGDELTAETLTLFCRELISFQNVRVAERYLEQVAELATAERDMDPSSRRLAAAVTAGLFKLTAYKDEYEVARLLLDSDGHTPVAEVAKPDDRVAWQLHPPLLRSMGRKSKISFSTRWKPLLRLLAASKRLRGTWLDPFRWGEVRRTERHLVGEYLTALRRAVADDGLRRAIQIAEAADLVRGYEQVKLRNVERFRAVLAGQPSNDQPPAGT